MAQGPTTQEICDIASQAVSIFSANGLRGCLFGSTVSWLHGLDRPPNDVDLVVFTAFHVQAQLKDMLVHTNLNRGFYLAPAATPGADYEVLWYRLPGRSYRGRWRCCKVDVLVPNNRNLTIPVVPHYRVYWSGSLPFMPLIPLLLVKLQGWIARRTEAKEAVDAQDVYLLLQLAVGRREHVWQTNLGWLSTAYIRGATVWISEYVEEYSKTEEGWRMAGFNVHYQGKADDWEIDSD
ncbi:hypothetical protein L226DRAFT_484731 [Lentinus tigrinus ALCF2SS1-7]|uniref:Nucleotidyltransferase n=1 Tax=Lentinus tigrinus ALCF2SS1-6 TaxID=1328759 RepID=A0A5C2SB97_9APHY|nr:hypothetical protein L227DRAFT_525714 [Lentinus tigrinus ALCF2SS1-6]RPD75798.1 hypothetical protein L226DRAFT_484731 [Lentinus tigrinus ALCF2SS1-7]